MHMQTVVCIFVLSLQCTLAFLLGPSLPSGSPRSAVALSRNHEVSSRQRTPALIGLRAELGNGLISTIDDFKQDRRQILSAAAASILLGMLPAASMAETAGAKPSLLVTGANSGIGEAVAAYLGGSSCNVILACRTAEKAKSALERLTQRVPEGSFQVLEEALDYADFSTIKPFAKALRSSTPSLQGLVHCAGIDGAPETRTPQGFELHMASNHLGPFALTAELLPLLRAHPTPSVVALTSSAALDLNPEWLADLNWKQTPYNKRAAYCLSKACNVLFTDELSRREPSLFAASVDPGPTITQIVRYELPKRAEQRRTMSEAQLVRQAKQLGFRTPAQAAVQTSLLALQKRGEEGPDLIRGGFLGVAAPPGYPGPPVTEPLPWRTPDMGAKVWKETAELVKDYISDPSILA